MKYEYDREKHLETRFYRIKIVDKKLNLTGGIQLNTLDKQNSRKRARNIELAYSSMMIEEVYRSDLLYNKDEILQHGYEAGMIL